MTTPDRGSQPLGRDLPPPPSPPPVAPRPGAAPAHVPGVRIAAVATRNPLVERA